MTKLHSCAKPMKSPPRYMESHLKLAKNRILFLSEDFSDEMGAETAAMLLYFDSQSNDPIEIYIHSNGGSVDALVNICDVINMISSPVKTVCVGKSYSAGALLLSSGTKGMRYAMKNSSIMIHGVQFTYPLPGSDFQNSKSYLDFVSSNNDTILKILANNTGRTLQQVKLDCQGEVWMTAKQAKEYGIIDHIL